jgi:hypothetical protein
MSIKGRIFVTLRLVLKIKIENNLKPIVIVATTRIGSANSGCKEF